MQRQRRHFVYEADYKIKDSLGNILSVEWIYHSLPSRHPIVGKILFPCLFFFLLLKIRLQAAYLYRKFFALFWFIVLISFLGLSIK